MNIMKEISQIHRCFRAWRSYRMKNYALGGAQQHYLFHICKQPGVSQEKLRQHVMVNKSNVARQLSALEQDGWIERKVSSLDKRVYEVYPTQKALDILPEIQRHSQKWNQLLVEDLTEEEKQLLQRILPKLEKKAMQMAESERDYL